MDYEIVYSRRKTLGLKINSDGRLVVHAPSGVRKKDIEKAVRENAEWIEKAEGRVLRKKELYDSADISALKKKAQELLPSKVSYYASVIGVAPSAVKINSARTRFGSCSGKNSINFSCYLMLYPERAVDYVVVHELCHILHHNHSREFYKEIEKVLPDYKDREKLLRTQ